MDSGVVEAAFLLVVRELYIADLSETEPVTLLPRYVVF
jgi:hypothetical protein